MAYQGIGKKNMIKHRHAAVDATASKEDQAVVNAFKSKFCILLVFELFETHMPFHQAGTW